MVWYMVLFWNLEPDVISKSMTSKAVQIKFKCFFYKYDLFLLLTFYKHILKRKVLGHPTVMDQLKHLAVYQNHLSDNVARPHLNCIK